MLNRSSTYINQIEFFRLNFFKFNIKILLVFFLSLYFLSPVETNASGFFITSYDFNDEDAITIASKYDIIVTALNKSNAVSKVKSINPSIRAFYYKNSLTHGTSYYVLDTVTNKRIIHDDWGWYLHDISNPEYRLALANAIASCLATYTQFDGVFLDDVWVSISTSDFHQEGTSDDPHLPEDLIKNWKIYMFELIDAIKTAIGSKLLILNTGWYATDFLLKADGQMDENFAHANWQDPNEFLSIDSWKNHLNALQNAIANSKFYLAQSGVSDGATQEQINKLVRYSFSTFLMGVATDNNFAKHYFCPSTYYKNYYWYSDWEAKFGNPIGNYFQIEGTNFYRRNFEKGIVMVNPTNQTGKIALEKTYCNLDGYSISEINFSDYEGVILVHCDTNPPAPPKNLIAN